LIANLSACGGPDADPAPDTVVPGGDDTTETVETVETVETADTPDPPARPPPPDLSGVQIDGIGASVLDRCRVRVIGERRASVLPVASGDLDGDGQIEVVLFNEVCTDAEGAELIDPVMRFDAASGDLVLVEALRWRAADGEVPGEIEAASFVDMDGDGDPDLVADAISAGAYAFVWRNDGTGAFAPVPETGLRQGFWFVNGGFSFADVDRDGRQDVVAMGGELAALNETTRPVPLYNRLPDAMEVAPDAFPSFASAAQWTVMPFSDAPQDDPSRYVFTTSNKPVGAEDYVWRVADGANMPDDFFGMDRDPVSGAPRNAWWFVDPRCGSESPTCVTPMGGGTMRLTRPATGAVEDCVVISTGLGEAPVSVFCPRDGAYLEAGELVAQFSIPRALYPTPLPGGDASLLSWQISDRWDFNADGAVDVLITEGRDAFDFAPMPQFVFLGDAACADASCERYALAPLPELTGHHHGVGWFPVRGADGAWKLLGWLNSDAESTEVNARVAFFLWHTDSSRRWVALQLGRPDNLDAVGARVSGVTMDASGGVVGPAWERTHALTPTWGYPGSNPPIVVGVPEGAVTLHVEVDFPGCHPSVAIDLTAFNQPVDIDVPACP
jgi:hypothetical protein